MEADLFVFCKCGDKPTRNLFAKFIAESTRPIVSEDVPEKQQNTYELLDELEFPESLVRSGDDSLMIHWWLGGNFDEDRIKDDLNVLLKAGANEIKTLLFIDGAAEQFINLSKGVYKITHLDEGFIDAIVLPRSSSNKALLAYFQGLENKNSHN